MTEIKYLNRFAYNQRLKQLKKLVKNSFKKVFNFYQKKLKYFLNPPIILTDEKSATYVYILLHFYYVLFYLTLIGNILL